MISTPSIVRSANRLKLSQTPTTRPSVPKLRVVCGLCALLMLVIPVCYSQSDTNDYLERVGRPDFTTAAPVEKGFINLANGNLHLDIPIASIPGRGSSFNVSLTYDSRIYTTGAPTTLGFYPFQPFSTNGGWNILLTQSQGQGAASYSFSQGTCNTTNGNTGTVSYFNNWIYSSASGETKNFYVSTTDAGGQVGQSGTECASIDQPTANGFAADGSGFYISVSNYDDGIVYDDRGNIVAHGGDGNLYPLEDSNGNMETVDSNRNYVDTVERNPVLVTTSGNVSYVDVLSALGASSRSRYTITYETINVNTAFGEPNTAEYTGTITVVQSLQLPNGTSYSFTYDSGTAPGNYGLLSTMTLPTGGQIDYTYTTFVDMSGFYNRWIATRTSLGNKWSYTPLVTSAGHQLTVTKPNNESATYSFDEADVTTGSWNTTTVYKDANGNTVENTLKEYNPALGTQVNPFDGRLPARLTTTLTTANGGTISKKTEYSYDSIWYGNVTEAREWDWFTGNPPSNPTRVTDATYTASVSKYLTQHIVGKAMTAVVKDGSGNIVAQEQLEYDNYTAGIASSGAVQHDGAFGTGFTLRGNLTALEKWRNTDGIWLTTRNQYDDAGNVIQTTDPNQNLTFFSYVDSWGDSSCAPSGGNAAAFRTQVKNALGQISSSKYNSCNGSVASATDVNSQTTSYTYDNMSRLTQTNFPDGGQKSTTYPDATHINQQVKVTSALTDNSSRISDALGRISQEQHVLPNGTASVATTYDALGRVSTVTNPYFSTVDPTYGITQTQYDALGRVSQVTKPDGSIVATAYEQPGSSLSNVDCTTTTDEAGKSRRACSDALGRLVEVDEPPAASPPGASATATVTINGSLQVAPSAGFVDARSNSPVVMASPGDFYYVDTNGHVRELTLLSSEVWANWNNADITGGTGAPAAASNSQLAAYYDSSGRTYVLYVAASQHVEILYYNNGWFSEDLTSTFGNVLARSDTPFAMPAPGDFFYLDTNGHLRQAMVVNGVWQSWSNADLTAGTSAPAAAGNSQLGAYWSSSAGTYMLYVTVSQHVEVIYAPGINWFSEDLSSAFGNVLARSDTPFAMPAPGDFFYLDSNGHLREAAVANGVWQSWSNADLTAGTSAPAAATNSQLGAFYNSSEGTYVLYVTGSQHLEAIYWPSDAWLSEDLTSTYGNVLASSGTPIVLAGGGDFYYQDSGGNVREVTILSNGTWAGWTNYDATAGAGAPAAISGSQMIGYKMSTGDTYVLHVNSNDHMQALWYANRNNNWNGIDLGGSSFSVYDSGIVSLSVGDFVATACFGNSTNSACSGQPVNLSSGEVAWALAQAINTPNSPATATATGNGNTINLVWKTPGPFTPQIGALSTTHDNPGSFSSPSFTSAAATFENGTSQSFSNAYVTLYTYDLLGNLTSVNQKGDGSQAARVRNFTYDSLSRLLAAQNPESGSINYTYDADGNLLQKTSPAPNQTGSATQTISYCYDSLNRVTGKAYSAQTCSNGRLPSGTAVATYGYDSGTNDVGYLTSLTDQAGSASFTYEVMGRMAGETRTLAGFTKSMNYAYNLDGSLKTLTNPSGAVITYTPWNNGTIAASGAMQAAADNGNAINYVTAAAYGPHMSITGFTSGQSGSFSGIGNSFSYNNRLQPVTMSAASPSATVFSLTYNFSLGVGDNGNVIEITNNKDNTRNQSFTYDSLNRLTSAQNAGTNCSQTTLNPNQTEYWGDNYGYDAWGNLLAKSVTKCGAENLAVSADTHNQIHATSGPDYTYDAAGNMTFNATPPTQTYTYDAENRIASAATSSGTETYTYDADGNRVEKSNGASGRLYWYMSPGIVAESDLSGNLQSEYVFFAGERVARKDLPSGNVAYYFSDHLKTTDIVTDAQGNIKNESDFYPWGGELEFSANDANHYKFTGKERDIETGLDYFGARYYSNGLGRFITPDWAAKATAVPYAEFADPQSLNLYTYVRNLPTVRFDPDGHRNGVIDGDATDPWLAQQGIGAAPDHSEDQKHTRIWRFFHNHRLFGLMTTNEKRADLLAHMAYENGAPLTAANRYRIEHMSDTQINELWTEMQGHISDAASKPLFVPVPDFDLNADGKVHGKLPDRVPDNWTRDDMEHVAQNLEESIQTRQQEQIRLGEEAGHRLRIEQERELLRQIQKKLSGS